MRLEDEPSLAGTVLYVCISDFMLDFCIYAFWRGCILGSSVSLEQLLGDGVQMYIDNYEEPVLTSILSGIDPLSFISKGGADILDRFGHLVRDEVIHCCSRRCRLCDSKTGLQSMVQFDWCIDIVGENTINDLNLQLERVIVVPTMTWNMCNFVIS